MHNGAPVNFGLLNEKWEALALVPVYPELQGKGKGKVSKGCAAVEDEYYLFTLSDNDFITNNGTYGLWLLDQHDILLTQFV